MNCRRSSSIKDSILMPPPKAITNCSHVSKSDTSEDLKRNLKEISSNIHTNTRLYKNLIEELKNENHVMQEQIPNFLTSNITSSNNNSSTPQNISNQSSSTNTNSNIIIQNTLNKDHLGLNRNNSYSCLNNIANSNTHNLIASCGSLNKKISANNLEIEENSQKQYTNTSVNNSNTNINTVNLIETNIFKLLPPPKNPQEIQAFVDHLSSSLKKYRFKGSYHMSIELETRYSDYIHQALKGDYFKECLIKLQAKIFNKINSLVLMQQEENLRDLKENVLNSNHTNPGNYINSNLGSLENANSSLNNNKEWNYLNHKRRCSYDTQIKAPVNLNSGVVISKYNVSNMNSSVDFQSPLDRSERVEKLDRSFPNNEGESSEVEFSVSNANTNNESFPRPLNELCNNSVISSRQSTLNRMQGNSSVEKESKKNCNQTKTIGSPTIII